MTDPYPVVSEKRLDPALRRGLFGRGRPRREWDDLPVARANQVRVYLVNGQHVVDSGSRALDDEAVVRASYVNVVDLTRDREVMVEFGIPSGDAKEFTVRVTFKCHVTDPVTVVKEGQGDAARALLGYVRSHQKLFLLGLDHKISQVDEVRRLVQTQIQAYTRFVPPYVPGMHVALSYSDVATPDEWAAHSGKMTNADFANALKQVQDEHASEQELLRKKHEIQLHERDHVLQQQQQRGRHELTSNANDFDQWQMKNTAEAVAGDPHRALWLAQQRGELTVAEVTERLLSDAEHKAVIEAEDRQWNRERVLQRETWDREDRTRVFVERLEVYKELARHGHLDEMGMDEIERSLDRLVGRISGAGSDKPQVERPEETRSALDEGDGPDTSDELREENSG